MIKVMVFGTFDNVHQGHKYFLTKAKELGDYLVVLIARDETVFKVKEHYPHQPEAKRLEELSKTGIADKVILGTNGADKYTIIREENPDVIALGYDQIHFTTGLENEFGRLVKIVRIGSYKPDIYKSSKLNPYHKDEQK